MNQREVHALPREKLIEIAGMYGTEIADFGPIEGGYRNVSHSFTNSGGQKYNFILYKNEPGIVELIYRTNALGLHVAASHLPVRLPLDARILQVGHRYGSLYSYLDGVTIPWEGYTMKHIKLLGYAMAEFHAAGVSYAGPALPGVETVYSEIAERMSDYFARKDIQRALLEKQKLLVRIPDFQPILDFAKQLRERIPLHMDMVRSNVLFRGATSTDVLVVEDLALSGILDLEKAALGHPLFDVARTLAFLLVDCTKPDEKIRKYFLDSGYRKRGGRDLQPVMVNGDDMLEQLITLFLTYDLYKFLKQNPYESLSKNHHFKRTTDILLTRKVVQYSN